MSESKFNKAVEIIQALPKEGPIKPSQDDQLFVSSLELCEEMMNLTLCMCM